MKSATIHDSRSEMRNDGILFCLTFQRNGFGNWQKQRQENVQHARINLRVGEKKDGGLFGSKTVPLPCWRDFGEKFEKWSSSIVHLFIVDNFDNTDSELKK